MTQSSLPPLHPDRIGKAIRWFEIEQGTFTADDVADIGEEYETAIVALKTMAQFQKTCRLTPGTVDTAILIRQWFDNLRQLIQRQ